MSLYRMGPSGVEALVKAIGPQVTRLDISGNNIGAEGAAIIGRALMQNTSLQHINLANNGIPSQVS